MTSSTKSTMVLRSATKSAEAGRSITVETTPSSGARNVRALASTIKNVVRGARPCSSGNGHVKVNVKVCPAADVSLTGEVASGTNIISEDVIVTANQQNCSKGVEDRSSSCSAQDDSGVFSRSGTKRVSSVGCKPQLTPKTKSLTLESFSTELPMMPKGRTSRSRSLASKSNNLKDRASVSEQPTICKGKQHAGCSSSSVATGSSAFTSLSTNQPRVSNRKQVAGSSRVTPTTGCLLMQSSASDQPRVLKGCSRVPPTTGCLLTQSSSADQPSVPKGKQTAANSSSPAKTDTLTAQTSAAGQAQVSKGEEIVGTKTWSEQIASIGHGLPPMTNNSGTSKGKEIAGTKTCSPRTLRIGHGLQPKPSSAGNHKRLTLFSSNGQPKQPQEPPPIYHIKSDISVSEFLGITTDEISQLCVRCELCKIDLAFPPPKGYCNDKINSRMHAVLPCRHCFHACCLENLFGPVPTCVRCVEAQAATES